MTMLRGNIKASLVFLLAPLFMACPSASVTSKVTTADSQTQPSRSSSKTIDGWQRTADLPGTGNSRRIQCDNDLNCWLSDSRELWQSLDQGETWTLVNKTEKEEPPLGYHFVNRQIGWRYSAGNLSRSFDGGKSWTVQEVPINAEQGEIRAIWFNSEKIGWIAGGVYRALTREEQRIGVPNNARYGDKVLEYGIFRTDDGGETWKEQSVAPKWVGRIRSVRFFDERHGVAVGQIVYYTNDGGSSWKKATFEPSCVRAKYLNDEYEATPEYVAMFSSTVWWLSFSDGRVAKSMDGGHSWCDVLDSEKSPVGEAAYQYFTLLHFNSPEHGWALGSDKLIYETTDGGANWKRLLSDLKFDSIFFVNPNEGFAASSDGIFRIHWK